VPAVLPSTEASCQLTVLEILCDSFFIVLGDVPSAVVLGDVPSADNAGCATPLLRNRLIVVRNEVEDSLAVLPSTDALCPLIVLEVSCNIFDVSLRSSIIVEQRGNTFGMSSVSSSVSSSESIMISFLSLAVLEVLRDTAPSVLGDVPSTVMLVDAPSVAVGVSFDVPSPGDDHCTTLIVIDSEATDTSIYYEHDCMGDV